MYSHVRAKREEGESYPITRMFYAIFLIEAAIKSDNLNIVDITDTLNKRIEQEYGTKITGFLYIKGLFVLHFLEGKSEAINGFM